VAAFSGSDKHRDPVRVLSRLDKPGARFFDGRRIGTAAAA
jgi:hypothetical protein